MKNNEKHAYKPETVKKYLETVKAKIAEYEKVVDSLKVCISKGNSKIGNTMNVSTAAIVTCENCSSCSLDCYDIKACIQYVNVMNARARNTAICNMNRDLFFLQVSKAMDRRKKNKYLRWHVSGEIQDYDYLDRMVKNAIEHPDFIVWTYTKMHVLVNLYIAEHGGTKEKAFPSNLHIMFSVWGNEKIINPYNMPTFRCVTPESEQIKATEWKCTGNCQVCIEAGHGCVAGESSATGLH